MKLLKSEHAHYIIVLGRQLPLIAKKHPRARSMVVRYDARAECVRLTLPRYVSLKSGLEFAASKAGWIAVQIGKQPRMALGDGAEIPLFGETIKIMHVGGRGVVSRRENTLHVTGDIAFIQRRVRDYIKQETKKILLTRSEHYATQLGVSFRSLSLRDTSSRWGSCSAKGGLSFCWRLAFAPLEILDYVACHEVAHLRHHNHSPAFWQAVALLCPEYETHERWLKRHGQSIMGLQI